MKILAIDDNPDNLTTLKAVVADALPGAEILTALSGAHGIALARAEDPDVVLLDIVMPGMDGFSVCRKLKEDELLQSIPVVFLTAMKSGRDLLILALEAGAEGFLSKPLDEVELLAQIRVMARIKAANRLQRLEKDQLAALVAERTQELEKELDSRKRAEDTLRENEARFRAFYDLGLVGLAVTSPEKGWLQMNDRRCQMLEYGKDELRAMTWTEITHPDDRAADVAQFQRLLDGEVEGYELEKRFITRSSSILPIHLVVRCVRKPDRSVDYVAAMIEDMTERKRAEEEQEKLQAELTQAQKMESVGRLAGGVAHDFNNMLTVIQGNAAMVLEDLPSDSPHRDNLAEIEKCAKRSADLTRQLLAFARKQTVSPKVLDLNETLESMLKMLRRLIGEDIDLAWHPATGLWPIKADPSQIDQVLANLCVNARDAIGGVGKITLETENIIIDQAYCDTHTGIVPGKYVALALGDDGCGMEKEVLAHLFEPFFTTKEIGKGTGLGLATVYGIVKQNQGFIDVQSEPGRGTTFKLHMPRHAEKAAQIHKEGSAVPTARGHETILLVEDEPSILKIGRRILESLGYTVLTAGTPGDAVRLASEHAGEIHLLMTDVIMPEMNGQDLAKSLLSLYPGLKRLFMSGYTADVIAHHGILEEGIHFLQKPFRREALADKVREALAP